MTFWHKRRGVFLVAGALFVLLFVANFIYYPELLARRGRQATFPQFLLSPSGLLLDIVFVAGVLAWMWVRAVLPAEKEYLRGIVTLVCAANLGVVLGAAAGAALLP